MDAKYVYTRLPRWQAMRRPPHLAPQRRMLCVRTHGTDFMSDSNANE